MRCPRCGYDNASEPTACAQCGSAQVSATPGESPASAGRSRSEAATPVWQRPKAPKQAEAPPWSGADNAAPWQTPPEFGVPGRPRAEPAPTMDVAPAVSEAPSSNGGGPRLDVPAAPPKPARSSPTTRGLVVASLLGAGAAAAVVYGAYALVARRSIFGTLAEQPSAVSLEAAEGSDATNLVLFLLAGLLTLAAGVGLGLYCTGAASRSGAGVPFGLGWLSVAGLGLVGVIAALALHLGQDPARIASGYLVLGLAAVLVAVAMAWAAVVVVRLERPAPERL